MLSAAFYFHGVLNDFLPHRQKEIRFVYTFEPHQSLKHLIEALGVPHLEVGLVLVNGQPAVDAQSYSAWLLCESA